MAQQLVFAALEATPAPPPEDREFVRGVQVDRSGIAQYVHLIRSADDPERSPRPVGGRADRAPHRTLSVRPVATCCEDILRLLSDGHARTFNAIGVELLDLTSATLFGSPYDEALWELVERQQLEHTLDVPILFRLPEPPLAGDELDSAQAP
jgi:hypothetical protein